MKHLILFEKFSYVNESYSDKKDDVELSNSIEKDVLTNEYGNKYVKVNTKEVTKELNNFVDDLLKNKLQGFKLKRAIQEPDYKSGYGAESTTWYISILDVNGDTLEITYGWSNGGSSRFGKWAMPYPVSFHCSVYGEVHFHYGSIRVGGGVSSDKTSLSREMRTSIEADLLHHMSSFMIDNSDMIFKSNKV